MSWIDNSPTNSGAQTIGNDFAVQQAQLARQRALSQSLLDSKLPEGQMVSGWYVPPSGMSYLANGLQKVLGAYTAQGLDEKEKKLASDQNSALAQSLGALFPGDAGSTTADGPGTPPSSSQGDGSAPAPTSRNSRLGQILSMMQTGDVGKAIGSSLLQTELGPKSPITLKPGEVVYGQGRDGKLVPLAGDPNGLTPENKIQRDRLEWEKSREAGKDAERKQEQTLKYADDKAKADANLSALEDLDKSFSDLEDLISTGKVKTGRVKGPLGDALAYVPGVDSKHVDRFKTLSGDVLVGKMQSLKGTGSLSDKDIDNIKPTIPQLSADPAANLENIAKARAYIAQKKAALAQQTTTYDQAGAPGVPPRGTTFTGPSTPAAPTQHGATFSW